MPEQTPVTNSQTATPIVEVPKEAPKTETGLPPKYAILAAQQRKDREAQRKSQEERAAWETEKSKYIPIEEIQKNALAVLARAGVSYDKLTEQALVETDPVQAKLAKITDSIGEMESRYQKQQQEQQKAEQLEVEAARKQLVFEASKIVEDPAYEVVKFHGQDALDRVADKIIEHYNDKQQLLGVEEAVKLVDTELTEELKRYTSLNRLKSMFETAANPTVEAVPPKAKASTNTITTTARTLTNSMTPATKTRLTEKERRERAIRAARGEPL